MKAATYILAALAPVFALAQAYGPGTTDSDNLRSGTPVVTNAWLAVSNETAQLVASSAVDPSMITDGTNAIDAARNVYTIRGTGSEWRLVSGNPIFGSPVWQSETGYYWPQPGWYVNIGDNGWSELSTDYYATTLQGVLEGSFAGEYVKSTNMWERSATEFYKSGKLALTNDIPTITPPDFTTNNAQLVATIEAKAPAPGNYSAVSNAAMNARNMTDLTVRGSPQGEGSYFFVNDESVTWFGDHEDPADDGWYGSVHISPLAGGYYGLNTGSATTNFMLHGEDYSATLNIGGETYHIQGFRGTLALNADIPKGAVTTNEQGVAEANLGIYGSLAQGTNVTASGAFSHAEGDRTLASGKAAHAEGVATRAQGEASHAQGVNTYATQRATFAAGVSVNGTNSASFVWSGQETSPWYGTHGKGSFNVDPIGGIAGMWIGNDALLSILYASLSSDEPHTATIEFDETAGTSVTTNFPPLREAVVGTIREHSLMGIWDDKLGVWWTPHMSNGAYYWTATTNVNLAAEGNQ